MRNCDRCGSRLPENSQRCPLCDSMTENEREVYRTSSKIIFASVFAITVLHALFYIFNCSYEIMRILTVGESYRPPSVFIEFTHNKLFLNVTTVIIMYGLLPAAFMSYNLIILARDRSKFLIFFPICGIAAEAAQLAQQCSSYDLAIQEKMSYLYAIIAMDVLSALLITGFFAVMIRFILRGYSISQSRWLIVAGFVFVFARVLIKFTLYDDNGIAPNFSELKGYLLFSATLLNVKKRLITSKTL